MTKSEENPEFVNIHRPNQVEDAVLLAGSLAIAAVCYKFGAEINSFLATTGTQLVENFFHDPS